jgi:Asp-tRNA(Asn)/Glu-tRNA(Gln) amidotransferase B subunit
MAWLNLHTACVKFLQAFVETKGMLMISDDSAIEAMIDKVQWTSCTDVLGGQSAQLHLILLVYVPGIRGELATQNEVQGIVAMACTSAVEHRHKNCIAVRPECFWQVLASNPKQLEEYRGGKTKLLGFFEG